MTWRVLIADDSSNIRSATKLIFEGQKDFVVCGEAASGKEAIKLTRELNPDALLLDMQMSEMNGLEAAAEIRKHNPSLPIILYSLHESSMLERQAKAVGITKVVPKDAAFDSLIATLQKVFIEQRADNCSRQRAARTTADSDL